MQIARRLIRNVLVDYTIPDVGTRNLISLGKHQFNNDSLDIGKWRRMPRALIRMQRICRVSPFDSNSWKARFVAEFIHISLVSIDHLKMQTLTLLLPIVQLVGSMPSFKYTPLGSLNLINAGFRQRLIACIFWTRLQNLDHL